MMTLDLQVNGFAGVDFNSDDLTAESLHHACAEARKHGAHQFLATVITDDLDAMARRLARMAALREEDALVREVIVGFHVEGPFLNETPGYIGAHPAQHAQEASVEATKRLLHAAQGLVRLVTLAPERDPGLKTTAFLAAQGIVVSAGHCDPTLDELRAAADAGLTMFTHVGNGCPMTLHRHDNIIQRALSLADRLWLCFIADGAHIPFFTLRNYLRGAGVKRCLCVTDAISAAGLGAGRYRLGAREIDIGADLIAWGPNKAHLVGSTVTMTRTARNLAELGFTAAEVEMLTAGNPRRALGLDPA